MSNDHAHDHAAARFAVRNIALGVAANWVRSTDCCMLAMARFPAGRIALHVLAMSCDQCVRFHVAGIVRELPRGGKLMHALIQRAGLAGRQLADITAAFLVLAAALIFSMPLFAATSMQSNRSFAPARIDVAAAAPVALFAPSSAQRELGSLRNATGWLNSPPLSADDLRGKVVLVDFWTYSCINWIRTLPWLRAWADRYGKHGLVIIGVHTPEFEFEKNGDNVRRFVRQARIDYPVAIDSDYAIWRGFGNQYWPALYLIDAQGRIRHQRFGEGEYDRAEKMIQQLLIEAGASGITAGVTAVDGQGVEADADWGNLRTPETYAGHSRAGNLASPGGVARDVPRDYTMPSALRLNQWALSGNWTVTQQYAALNRPNGNIVFRFHARDLHLVMGPSARGTSVRYRVRIDGQPPGADRGVDVDEAGMGAIVEPRLHQLIRQRSRFADRLFEIEFLDPGVEVYAFTFG